MGATATILADLFILFVRLNQPAVIGELLAGILFGPFALSWLSQPQEAARGEQMGTSGRLPGM